MRIGEFFKSLLPGSISISFAFLSSIVLAASFPDFEIASLAWIALIPLFISLEREKNSKRRAFITGWVFGTFFFFLTGWWLTFAPITYAGFPSLLAYFLLLCVALVAGLFPAAASLLTAHTLKRFGRNGIFAAPFYWIGFEFLRFWLTGNNWNTIGYSQAFTSIVEFATIGGVHVVGFTIVILNAAFSFLIMDQFGNGTAGRPLLSRILKTSAAVFLPLAGIILVSSGFLNAEEKTSRKKFEPNADSAAIVVAVQPNVPMAGLDRSKWSRLRARQTSVAGREVQRIRSNPELKDKPLTVILPESPMNYQYEADPEFRAFINGFATKYDVSVLFNSAEPDSRREYGFFNSAVLVSPEGEKIAQYDKIHLLPFGEFVPLPEFAQSLIPPMVGRFSFGEEYDRLPIGDAKSGVMICFESHFPSLSREYVLNGADVLIEMTNDGYLGPTPVLRQHLASAAFRAAETHRPVLRTTNVGVTAYIDEWGKIHDEADVYKEDVKVWGVSKSEGKITYSVRFGDWFAWLCSLVSIGLVGSGFLSVRNSKDENPIKGS